MRYWLHTIALCALVAGALEIAARTFMGVPAATRFDPRYDRMYEPGQLVVQSTEGFSRGRINELGNLDAPMPAPLPPDGILVIGDSYTEGMQVAMDDRFTDLTGAELGRRVYNVGHAGWSPLNAVAFLGAELPRYRPSTVIVQVSGNDLKDLIAPSLPHLVDGPHGLSIAVPNRGKHGLGAKITAVREAVSRSAYVADMITAGLTVSRGADEGAADTGLACEHPDPLSVRGVDWIAAQLAAAHPDVRLLYLPTLDYHHGCIDTCGKARDLFARAAAAHGLRVIDPTAALCRRFAETEQPLNGFWNTVPGTGHYNADGHRVIAAELVRALRGGPP